MPLLADCENEEIDDVYKRDIVRMEQIVLMKRGIGPFIRQGDEIVIPGFFVFEMYSNTKWRIRNLTIG